MRFTLLQCTQPTACVCINVWPCMVLIFEEHSCPAMANPIRVCFKRDRSLFIRNQQRTRLILNRGTFFCPVVSTFHCFKASTPDLETSPPERSARAAAPGSPYGGPGVAHEEGLHCGSVSAAGGWERRPRGLHPFGDTGCVKKGNTRSLFRMLSRFVMNPWE